MKITLVGMGMGNPDTLTRAAWSALEQAQRMIGARRLAGGAAAAFWRAAPGSRCTAGNPAAD